jgi:hypothetical protein
MVHAGNTQSQTHQYHRTSGRSLGHVGKADSKTPADAKYNDESE